MNDTFNPTTWMAQAHEAIKNRPLSALVIPGTHDSGSFGVIETSKFSPETDISQEIKDICDYTGGELPESLKASIPQELQFLAPSVLPLIKPELRSFIRDWSKTGDLDIMHQLEAGIRYFDLRVVLEDDGHFYFCHGLEGTDVEISITAVRDFVAANPKEIVILDFNHLYNMDDVGFGLIVRMMDILASKGIQIAPTDMTAQDTVDGFLNRGYQVIVCWEHRQDIEKRPLRLWRHYDEDWTQLLPENHIHGHWIQEYTIAELMPILIRDLANRCNNKLLANNLYVSQGLVSPNDDVIKAAIYSRIENFKNDVLAIARGLPTPAGWGDWTMGTAAGKIMEFIQDRIKDGIADEKIKAQLPNYPTTNQMLAKEVTPVTLEVIKERDVVNPNIVMVDWFQTTSFVQECYDINMGRLKSSN